jgi:hypothetical protein
MTAGTGRGRERDVDSQTTSGRPTMMKAILVAACLALAFAASAAEEKQPTPQQQKMADCNKQAGDKNLKGDERKAFMSTCLSAKG